MGAVSAIKAATRLQGLPDVLRVLQVVEQETGHTVAELLSDSTRRPLSRSRHLSWFILREELGMNYPAIGAMFGRDHTTIMNGYAKAVENMNSGVMPLPPEYKGLLDNYSRTKTLLALGRETTSTMQAAFLNVGKRFQAQIEKDSIRATIAFCDMVEKLEAENVEGGQ